MKKTLAIFAFLIFFFSQFGKVINFCLCTVAVYEKTSHFQCDCEKQLVNTAEAEAGRHHHSNATTLPQSEELFHLDNSASFTCRSFTPVIVYINGHTETLYNSYYNNIFHPPGHTA